jgi:hypothetical protein
MRHTTTAFLLPDRHLPTPSTVWPLTAKVNFWSAFEAKLTRAHSEASSLAASPRGFFRMGLRCPSCIATAESLRPSSEIPQWAT